MRNRKIILFSARLDVITRERLRILSEIRAVSEGELFRRLINESFENFVQELQDQTRKESPDVTQ